MLCVPILELWSETGINRKGTTRLFYLSYDLFLYFIWKKKRQKNFSFLQFVKIFLKKKNFFWKKPTCFFKIRNNPWKFRLIWRDNFFERDISFLFQKLHHPRLMGLCLRKTRGEKLTFRTIGFLSSPKSIYFRATL